MSDRKRPLVDGGAYVIHVDAAGFGPVLPARHHKRSNCNYLWTSQRGGRVRIQCEGVVVETASPTTWLIPPNRPVHIELDGYGELWWVHFAVRHDPVWYDFPHRLEFGLQSPYRQRFQQPSPEQVWGFSPPFFLPDAVDTLAGSQLPQVVGDWLNGHANLKRAANRRFASLVDAMVLELLPRPEPAEGDMATRIAAAEGYARSRQGRDIAVADMARRVGCHRAHFTTKYRELRGETPGVFLRRLRLENAAVMLRTQDISVQDVGTSVGYPDASAFARAFRTVYGCSPTAYRDRYARS